MMLDSILEVLEIVAWSVAFVSILAILTLIGSGSDHGIKKDYGDDNNWDDWDD